MKINEFIAFLMNMVLKLSDFLQGIIMTIFWPNPGQMIETLIDYD